MTLSAKMLCCFNIGKGWSSWLTGNGNFETAANCYWRHCVQNCEEKAIKTTNLFFLSPPREQTQQPAPIVYFYFIVIILFDLKFVLYIYIYTHTHTVYMYFIMVVIFYMFNNRGKWLYFGVFLIELFSSLFLLFLCLLTTNRRWK